MNILSDAKMVIFSSCGSTARTMGLNITIDHLEEDDDEIEIVGTKDESIIIPKNVQFDEEENTFFGQDFSLEIVM